MSHCRVVDPHPARLGLTLLRADLHLSCCSSISSPSGTSTADLLCVGASPAEILAKELEKPLCPVAHFSSRVCLQSPCTACSDAGV